VPWATRGLRARFLLARMPSGIEIPSTVLMLASAYYNPFLSTCIAIANGTNSVGARTWDQLSTSNKLYEQRWRDNLQPLQQEIYAAGKHLCSQESCSQAGTLTIRILRGGEGGFQPQSTWTYERLGFDQRHNRLRRRNYKAEAGRFIVDLGYV